MLRINHMLLLLILLASTMDSQIITFWLRSILPAPPQDHEPTISSTISLPICKPISTFTNLIQKLSNGAPTLHQFSITILPSLGHARYTGAPVSVFVHLFPKLFIIYYLLYKHSVSTFFVVTIGDFSFFGHTQPMSPLDWSSTYH
jgi:hypothetical protein